MNFFLGIKKLAPTLNTTRFKQDKNVRSSGFFAQFDLLKVFQFFLSAACVILFCLVIYKIFFNSKVSVGNEEKNVLGESELVAIWNPSEVKSFDSYQAQLGERDLFSKYQDKLVSENPQVVSDVVAPPVNILATLKLIGVWVDEQPQAVFIDTQNQETYFLVKGDKYKEAVVDEIQEGKVTFGYQNQKIDILQE